MKRNWAKEYFTDEQYKIWSLIMFRFLLLMWGRGSGKAQPLDARIMVPNGITTMGELKVGTKILNSYGGVSTVTGIFPQGLKEVVLVKFDDGNSVECCKEHLWEVISPYHHHNDWDYLTKVLSINDIKKIGVKSKRKDNQNSYNFWVRTTQPVFYEKREVSISPYLMGVLLGDGSIKKNIGYSSADSFIVKKINNLLKNNYKSKYGGKYNYSITKINGNKGSKGIERNNYYKEELIKYGLFGLGSLDKFIPDDYKYNSVENRLELIRGLMDTDGSVSGNTAEYSTISTRLAYDIKYVLEGLGCKVKLNTRTTYYNDKNGNKKAGDISYRLRITFKPELEIFSLPRKKESIKERTKYKLVLNRKIVDIIDMGKKECQCIMVDSKDSLYLTDSFIPTHNSELLMNLVIREASKPNKNIWILAPTEADVIRIYAKRISNLLKNVWKWKENKKKDFDSDDSGIWFITNRKTIFEFKNGSTISLISSDRCEKNEGDRCSLIILDEFAKFKKKDEFYSVYVPSLTPNGKLIIASTPKGKEEFWEIAQKAKRDKTNNWVYSYATAYSNTKYFEIDENGNKITWADKIKMDMDVMPHWQWEQEYLCNVSAVEGRCCPDFKEEYNLIKLPIKHFPEVPVYAGLDFNRSPMSWVLFQIVPFKILEENYPEILKGYYNQIEEYRKKSGRTYIEWKGMQDEIVIYLEEIKKDNMDIDIMNDLLKEKLEELEIDKIVFTGDASGNQRTAYSKKSFWESVKEAFPHCSYQVPPKNPSHWERINVITKKIRTKTGKVGLLVNDKCVNISDDFQQVIWMNGIWEIDKNKYDPHLFDACSYGVHKIFGRKNKEKKEGTQFFNINIYDNDLNMYADLKNSFQSVLNN